MRLYPPAWMVAREALEECEIGGYPVAKGIQLWMPQWVVHRDPRWFNEADEFRPERWDKDLAKHLPRGAYFPFGDGPRVCIGNHFAMLEAVLLLASIGQRFRFSRQVRAVRAVKIQEFGDAVLARLTTRVREPLAAGDPGEGAPAEDRGNLDADPAGVLAGAGPAFGAGAGVVVAGDQVVGGLPEHGTAAAVAAPPQGAVGAIDLVALVAAGQQGGAAGDGVGVAVPGDGPPLAGAVRDRDDVDAGDGQQQPVRGGGHAVGQVAFPLDHVAGLGEAVVVAVDEPAAAVEGQARRRGAGSAQARILSKVSRRQRSWARAAIGCRPARPAWRTAWGAVVWRAKVLGAGLSSPEGQKHAR
jgi:Cytochrome P450